MNYFNCINIKRDKKINSRMKCPTVYEIVYVAVLNYPNIIT